MRRIKQIILLSVIVVMTISIAQAQERFLWPIKDAKPGQDITSGPQSYIDGELNFSNMFITAPVGTTVLSPVDGTIERVAMIYLKSLIYSTSYGANSTFNNTYEEVTRTIDKSIDPKNIVGTLGIRCSDGRLVYIAGLIGDEEFKTGQKITQGTPIGTVSYSYHKIKEPSIKVSIDRYGKVDDPMTPFGLKSTFIPPQQIKPIVSLSKEQAKEDFLVYIDVLKEAYPGLNNVITTEELDRFVSQTVAEIESYDEDLPFADFWEIMNVTVAKIHDSHIYLHEPAWKNRNDYPPYQPRVWIGWINDTLICTNAVKEYECLIGREILRVNGMLADSAKNEILSWIGGFDAKAKEYQLYGLANNMFGRICPDNFDMNIVFANGDSIFMAGHSTKKGFPQLVHDPRPFRFINMHRGGYEFKDLNDSTAYLGLTTFNLNQVQVDEIANYIDSISTKKHFVIDLRNNSGGHVEVLEKLYSYIAGDTLVVNGYSRVNKKGGFKTLNYSMNYAGVEQEIFPDFVAEEGKDGFFQRSENGNVVTPDSVVNYKGRVYVLTNENSTSAATLFPALLVRNHRGVVVGRETRTAYHFMNALKFADIRLPNSTVVITIPLVELVFDTVVNDRVPYGRGLIPDYVVPLTLDEMNFKNGDAILNHTLELIEKGMYLSEENPFAVPEDESVSGGGVPCIIAAIVIGILIVVALVFVFFRKRRTRKGE